MTRRILLAALLAATAACSSGDDDATQTTATTAATSTTTTAATITTTTTTTTTTEAPGTTTTTAAATSTTTTTTTAPAEDGTIVVAITVAAGEVEGDNRVDIELGAMVRLVVTADVSDEVHVHGYDYFGTVTPDTPAEIEFEADIPGIFEVEMEGDGRLLTELEVAP